MKNCTDTDPLMFENITSPTNKYIMTLETARSEVIIIKGDELFIAGLVIWYAITQ